MQLKTFEEQNKNFFFIILNFILGGEEECDREYCTYCCVPETHGENGLFMLIRSMCSFDTLYKLMCLL